ncbi:unnamed protein product [Plutella xylostella]|uniref:(diamondback moth) hypothetical protein n=1 Tax=Plutella xylostella TaxID=51655 RepID=A0A8S4ED08_PLUXY|nr:unnamed protein product [Plutella xylostella]
MFVTPPNKRLRRRLREQVDAHDETKPGNVATMELPKCEVLDREPCVPTTSRTKEENIHDQLQKNATPYKSVIEGSRASSRSKRSTTSSTAKRKQLELEAAEAKAKIQLLLIDKRLEADLAKIEAEEEESDEDKSTTTIDDHRRSQVEEWLNHSQQAGPAGATSRPPSPPPPPASAPPAPAPAGPAAGVPAAARHAPVQHQDQSLSSIKQLALELKNMMVSSPAPPDERLLSRLSTPRDLPSFGGDCIEWLHFKTAYDESTRVCQFSDSENLWRLRKALRGEALEAVTDLLIGNTPPGVVMESLQLRFGRSDIIIQRITSQLKNLPSMPTYYQQNIFNFAVKINNCVASIKALNQDDYLRSPELATAVMSKLPSTLLGKWTDYAYSNLSKSMSKLEVLAKFLKHEAEMLSFVGISQPPDNKQNNIPQKRAYDNKPYNRPILATTTVEVNASLCKFCKKANHLLPECRVFKRTMRRDRWRFVKMHGLCYCCLVTRHDKNSCDAPVCDVDDCGLAHHRLLHWKKPGSADDIDPSSTSPPPPPPPPPRDTVAHVASSSDVSATSSGDVMLKVVKVKLCGPNGVVCTYALLDDAASVSLIDSELANQLGLEGQQSSAVKFIDAFGLEVYQSDAPKVCTSISGQDNDNSYDITLRNVSKLNLPMQNLSVVNNITSEHLLHLNNDVCNENVVPRLLIGEDNYFLLAPLDVIHGNKDEPYATRCRLGWSIHGYCGRSHYNTHVSQHIFHLAHSDSNDNFDNSQINELNNLMKEYFSLDSIGISTLCRDNTAHFRALHILDETARQIGEQWEVGLPFKTDNFIMPESYGYAHSRLQMLNKKFQKDTGYAEHYRKEVHKLFEDGYARELSEDELAADQVWYFPHFGVQNPNKPGKLRLVFDAAGKVKGTCLNDYLLTGPDLYNSLLGIMYRFRENKVVITGDIKDMFLRINIRSEDQNVLRFLWQEPPPPPAAAAPAPPAPPAPPGPRAPSSPTQSPLKLCTMQSLIFGATCSPFTAQYIKNKNALKYEDLYPEAVQAIIKNYYMDDCLYSCDNAETAINLVNQITTIHKHGGFEIRRWSSNCKQVLDNIPSDALAQTAIQMKDGATNMSERTLGLIWHPAEDCFAFKVSFSRVSQEVLDGTTPPTKAKMLGLIMSIYDIHGFLSPFIIKSKVILQDVHRSGIDWNCHIQAKEFSSWCKWLDELKLLESIRIPRWYLSDDNWTECYSVTEPELCDNKIVNNTQMHIFCDASIKAYATVIFWRFTRFDGRVKVCFVGSKCRVTPLRPVSIPRLELQAALLAARLAHTVQTEHKDMQPNQRFFWTDSSTVLQWLRSDPRSYKPYVAHRLGELDELAAPAEWRHVPSRLNAADVATRPDAPPLALTDVWFQGPAFLRRPEEEWPKDLKTCKIVDEAACEERNINLVVSRDTSVAPDALRLPNENNISKWTTLLRSTARILLLFRRPKGDYCLDVDLMRKAETLVIRKSQQDAFGQEIECLRNNKPLPSNSRLMKLTPYLDDDGLLRVEGRIDKVTGVSTSTTRPAILDGKHRVAQLLVEHEHRRALHGAHEHVVNELRQRYWVVKLRSAVRAAAARCRALPALPPPPRRARRPAHGAAARSAPAAPQATFQLHRDRLLWSDGDNSRPQETEGLWCVIYMPHHPRYSY